MRNKLLGIFTILLTGLFAMGSTNENLVNSKSKPYTWCCTHSSHRGGESACTMTSRTFNDYSSCDAHRRSHDKNTGHSSGCR